MISKLIKEKMQNEQISIYKLSKESRIAYATLHNIISGETKNPGIKTLLKLSKALKEPINTLIEVSTYEKSNIENKKEKE